MGDNNNNATTCVVPSLCLPAEKHISLIEVVRWININSNFLLSNQYIKLREMVLLGIISYTH